MPESKKVWPVLGVAVVVVFVSVLAYLGFSDSGSSDNSSGDKTVFIASPEELVSESAAAESPIYWAGPKEGSSYEFTSLPDGRYYVRYLTDGAEAGDSRPIFLTIGSYPVKNASAVLAEAAKNSGQVLAKTKDGGVMLINKQNPSSVYVAYPGSDVQIEVYDPDPKIALEIASSGALEPIS